MATPALGGNNAARKAIQIRLRAKSDGPHKTFDSVGVHDKYRLRLQSVFSLPRWSGRPDQLVNRRCFGIVSFAYQDVPPSITPLLRANVVTSLP
jgi:hypothetical protein